MVSNPRSESSVRFVKSELKDPGNFVPTLRPTKWFETQYMGIAATTGAARRSDTRESGLVRRVTASLGLGLGQAAKQYNIEDDGARSQ